MSETPASDTPLARKTMADHVKKLRDRGREVLKRYGWLRLFLQIGFGCFGALLAAVAGLVVANTGAPVDIPAEPIDDRVLALGKEEDRVFWRSIGIVGQIVGLAMVFVGQAFIAFADKGNTEVLGEAMAAAELAQDNALAERDRAAKAVEDCAAKLNQLTADTSTHLLALAQELEESDAFAESVTDENQRVVAEIKRLTILYTIVRSIMLDALEVVFQDDDVDYKYVVGAMLDSFVSFKTTLFGISDDYYSFSVYIPNEDGTKLTSFVTRRPNRRDEERIHREWEVGRGVSGIVFESSKEGVWEIRERKDLEKLRVPEDLMKEYDFDENRCIVGIPISYQGTVLGVLSASCAKEGIFDAQGPSDDEETEIDPIEPLRALSNSLALVLARAEAERGTQSDDTDQVNE